MKRKNYLICLLTAIILLPIGVQAKDKKKGKKNIPMTEIQTTGTQDRAIWVKLLWKISYPVIHNLAEGTLHQNMPIETRSGETAGYKDMTHLEAVGRTLAGVAPWLALPDDDTEEGKLRKQMREEVLKGLKNAAPPKLYGNHWMKLQKNAILNPSNPYVIVLVLTTTGYSSPD